MTADADKIRHRETSRQLLTQLDQLETDISSARCKHEQIRLMRNRSRLRREFAMHLCPHRTTTVREVFTSHGQKVVPIWKIAGIPSKRRKDAAATWMAARGCVWDGSAQRLRHEVRKALEQGMCIPAHSFGLHCEWTVEISEAVLEWRVGVHPAELVEHAGD